MVSDKAIRQGLYEKLNTASVTALLTDGSAGIVHQTARSNSNFPLVIFHKQSGIAVKRFGGNAFDDHLWLVKAVDRGPAGSSASRAEDIAKAVDDLLDFGSLSITGGTTLSLLRESDVDYVETEGDQIYRHHGALYRLRLAAN